MLFYQRGDRLISNKFRKKPVVIEAVQWNGKNINEIKEFTKSSLRNKSKFKFLDHYLIINTLEGDMRVDVGDYIIKGVHGEFYPCKPDIFKKTYEPVD